MKDIETREDIYLLVSSFYKEIRENELLGPIFNKHIAEDKWPKHLNKLTDFWVTALLGEPCFKGNPSFAHLRVDNGLKHTMDENHFKKWLEIWFATITKNFNGDTAEKAKNAAIRMAQAQFTYVLTNRN